MYIVFCVLCLMYIGFKYSYPFLDPACKVKVEYSGKQVKPLYRHMIHPNNHLAFIGLPFMCIAFYLFSIQVTSSQHYIHYTNYTHTFYTYHFTKLYSMLHAQNSQYCLFPMVSSRFSCVFPFSGFSSHKYHVIQIPPSEIVTLISELSLFKMKREAKLTGETELSRVFFLR